MQTDEFYLYYMIVKTNDKYVKKKTKKTKIEHIQWISAAIRKNKNPIVPSNPFDATQF